MQRTLFIILLLFTFLHLTGAREVDDPIATGRSPDDQFEVTNVNDGEGGFFVIRNSMGKTVFSGKSLREEFQFAWITRDVLWRSDSRLVAVSFHTTQVCVETIVFERIGTTLQRVTFPWLMWDGKIQNSSPYKDRAENETIIDNTHRRPSRWLKNGALLMNVTSGYERKSSASKISGYFATVTFTGVPVMAAVTSKTQITTRSNE